MFINTDTYIRYTDFISSKKKKNMHGFGYYKETSSPCLSFSRNKGSGGLKAKSDTSNNMNSKLIFEPPQYQNLPTTPMNY